MIEYGDDYELWFRSSAKEDIVSYLYIIAENLPLRAEGYEKQ